MGSFLFRIIASTLMKHLLSLHKNPLFLSLAILAAAIVWMASGIFTHGEGESVDKSETRAAASIPQVRVQRMQAETVVREIVISGRTEPNRLLDLRSEAEGTVVQLGSERGAALKAGSLIARLDQRDRQSRMMEAQALVNQRELEFSGIENLGKSQLTSPVQQAEAKARLESARAALERIKLEIAHTTITAPYAAMLQERSIEVGDYVRVGDKVADLVDLDPIIITGEVSEHEVAKLSVGGKGVAVTVDGKRHEGTVRYLAPQANGNTRSFQVELAVPNADHSIRAGMTAELRLLADTLKVHKLSAALLALADDGQIGVKLVDDNSVAHFLPVTLEGSATGGLQQVSGLPESIRLITVGQAFVTDGQKVQAMDASAERAQ